METKLFSSPAVIVFNKSSGQTSYDIIRSFKRKSKKRFQKIGHFGTLDPFAEGVLVVGFNGACKLEKLFHETFPKIYRGVGILGMNSVCGDCTCEPVEVDSKEGNLKNYKKEELEHCIREKFLGEYWQRPPVFSATKHRGKSLYKWAREGTFIEKPEIKREIFDFKIREIKGSEIDFEISVSSGTYIRVFFQDFAKFLETEGILKKLERISVGSLKVERAISVESISEENLLDQLIPIDEVFSFRKYEFLEQTREDLYLNGQEIQVRDDFIGEDGEKLWVYTRKRNLIGLASHIKRRIKPLLKFA